MPFQGSSTICSPSSIALARTTSSSAVSRATLPISLRYIRTGSSIPIMSAESASSSSAVGSSTSAASSFAGASSGSLLSTASPSALDDLDAESARVGHPVGRGRRSRSSSSSSSSSSTAGQGDLRRAQAAGRELRLLELGAWHGAGGTRTASTSCLSSGSAIGVLRGWPGERVAVGWCVGDGRPSSRVLCSIWRSTDRRGLVVRDAASLRSWPTAVASPRPLGRRCSSAPRLNSAPLVESRPLELRGGSDRSRRRSAPRRRVARSGRGRARSAWASGPALVVERRRGARSATNGGRTPWSFGRARRTIARTARGRPSMGSWSGPMLVDASGPAGPGRAAAGAAARASTGVIAAQDLVDRQRVGRGEDGVRGDPARPIAPPGAGRAVERPRAASAPRPRAPGVDRAGGRRRASPGSAGCGSSAAPRRRSAPCRPASQVDGARVDVDQVVDDRLGGPDLLAPAVGRLADDLVGILALGQADDADLVELDAGVVARQLADELLERRRAERAGLLAGRVDVVGERDPLGVAGEQRDLARASAPCRATRRRCRSPAWWAISASV